VNYRSTGWDPGFTPQDVSALSSITEGPVLVAGDPELADELLSADVTSLHGPAITVGATSPADVQAAVRFATDFGLPLAVTSPGHDASGCAKGGVLITTSRMRRVYLDRRSRSAIAEVGAMWTDVVDRAAEVGLAPLVPSFPGTGIVGRAYGWTADHVRSVEVVTVDGDFRHVTNVSDQRLFRLLCAREPDDVDGGVITAMRFALYR
jgi:FAD/FMN-containing dehydrogenase